MQRRGLLRSPLRRAHLRAGVLALAGGCFVLIALARPTRLGLAAGLPPALGGELLRLWAAGHILKTDELARSGPYAYTRNPLYLGTLSIGLGFCVLAGWPAGGVAAVIGLAIFFGRYLPRKQRSESARLAALHGEAYARYCAAVPALLPGWTPWRGEGSSRRWSFERMRDNSEAGVALAVLLALSLIGLQLDPLRPELLGTARSVAVAVRHEVAAALQ